MIRIVQYAFGTFTNFQKLSDKYFGGSNSRHVKPLAKAEALLVQALSVAVGMPSCCSTMGHVGPSSCCKSSLTQPKKRNLHMIKFEPSLQVLIIVVCQCHDVRKWIWTGVSLTFRQCIMISVRVHCVWLAAHPPALQIAPVAQVLITLDVYFLVCASCM